jgi:hypothetical protein
VNRITVWANTRILELRSKIDDLHRHQPANPIGMRFAQYAIKRYEAELEHWLFYLGEDEE